MADDAKRQAGQQSPLESFADALLGLIPPGGAMSTDALAPLLEVQRVLLQRYRDALEQWTTEGDPLEHHRETVKALMGLYLESVQTMREHREQLVKTQSNFIARYLELLDKLLERRDAPPA